MVSGTSQSTNRDRRKCHFAKREALCLWLKKQVAREYVIWNIFRLKNQVAREYAIWNTFRVKKTIASIIYIESVMSSSCEVADGK